MRGWHILLAATAGGLMHLGLAPYHLRLAAFAAILLYAALLAGCARPAQAFKLALAFGTGLFGAGVSWIYVSIHIHGAVPGPLAMLFTGGFVLVLSLLFALPWTLLPLLAQTRNRRLLAFPAFWYLGEWLRGWLFTGFPWAYAGYTQIEGPLRGWLPVIGALGTGALLAGIAALLVYATTVRSGATIGRVLATGLGIGILSLYLAERDWTEPMEPAIPATLVQPDIPLRDKWDPARAAQIIAVLEANSRWQPGLLIWPEAAIPYVGGAQASSYLAQLQTRAVESDTAMFTGVLSRERGQYLNSLIGLGTAQRVYHKRRLVPFGEYVPLESWLRGSMHFFDLPMSVIVRGPPGQAPLPFRYRGQQYQIAPAICYEIAYTRLVRQLAADAQILLTISNDAWFGTSIGPWQHMQIAQARAAENRKPVLRVTNNGISGLIGPQGKIRATLPQFTRTQMQVTVTPQQGQTPYTRLGNWPGLALCTTLLLWLSLRRTKTPPTKSQA